jgi:penicillin-insensitive murein endopeptidase
MELARVAAMACCGLGLAGCIGLTPQPEHPASLGWSNQGALLGGVSLDDRGTGYVRARPGEGTRWGTEALVGALERAAKSVQQRFPGGPPVRIGDLSSRGGGQHPRHGSHRSGRDADVIFYAVDAHGRATRGRGWLAYDRFGVARDHHAGQGELYFFDDARNWHFVRSLLTDPHAPVQWIFVSDGVKSRLLRYGAAHEASPEVLFRAAWVLHEPSGARPHDDHYHIRLACTAEQRALGCRDRGPIWPWIRKQVRKPAGGPGPRMTDASLVRALLAEPEEGQQVARRKAP